MVEQFPSTERDDASFFHTYAWLIALIGLVALVGSGIIIFITRSWGGAAQVGLILGSVLLLGAALLRPDVVRTALAGRPVKYASNALVMTTAFIGILGLLNFLAVKYEWSYDATETGQFTLSEQTIQLLANLERPVHIVGFLRAGSPRRAIAEDYLSRSQTYTDYLSYEFHDPNVEPGLARSYGLHDYGLIFISGERSVEVSAVDEQGLVNGLVRVISDREKRALFVTGHGEIDIDESGPEGYSQIKEMLTRENYQVETTNLLSQAGMPSTETLLVLAGAQQTLSPTEQERIAEWVASGGKLLLLANPLDPAPLPDLLARYGLSLRVNLVADNDNHRVGLPPTSPLIATYPPHAITEGLTGYLTFLPLARSLSLTDSPVGASWHNTPLLTTGPNSWAETSLRQEIQYDEGVDPVGPFHLGAAAEDRDSGSRLVVFGSADFISNQHLLDEVANRDLFMNAVNWLTEDENLIALRPREATNRFLFLTPFQHNIIIFTSLIAIPLLILSAGAVVWWRRR